MPDALGHDELDAGAGGARRASTESRQALEGLCQAYWYPLYAFVRRQGFDPEESRDLTQAYFAQLLEKGYLDDYDPERGRFRVFLMASVNHFLSKEREQGPAPGSAGAARRSSPWTTTDVEGRYRHEPVDRSPRSRSSSALGADAARAGAGAAAGGVRGAGREPEFERLKGFLTGEQPKLPYRDVAAELGTSEAAVKTSVHRLRQRFGTLLREEIAETVAGPRGGRRGAPPAGRDPLGLAAGVVPAKPKSRPGAAVTFVPRPVNEE